MPGLRGVRGLRGVAAAPGVPVQRASDVTLGELARTALRRSARALVDHAPGALLGADPEELHRMRVAARRLRALLALFSEALPLDAGPLVAELQWLGALLGAVRDLDVQLARFSRSADEAPEEDRVHLAEIGRLLEAERAARREELLAGAASERYMRLVEGLHQLTSAEADSWPRASLSPAAVEAHRLVTKRHAAARTMARRARKSSHPEDLHRLRIACKRLRYALECTGRLYGEATDDFVRSLAKLQDSLGAAQDGRVAAERLEALVVSSAPELAPRTLFLMGRLAERCERESGREARRALADTRVLGGAKWRHLVAVMEQQAAGSSR